MGVGGREGGFNGAAAKSSGKWMVPRRVPLLGCRFNGAAAKSSGKSEAELATLKT